VTGSPTPFRRLLVCTECGQSGGSTSCGSIGRGEVLDKLAGLAFYCHACAAAELEPRLELTVKP
jgi:hypothetical protein